MINCKHCAKPIEFFATSRGYHLHDSGYYGCDRYDGQPEAEFLGKADRTWGEPE